MSSLNEMNNDIEYMPLYGKFYVRINSFVDRTFIEEVFEQSIIESLQYDKELDVTYVIISNINGKKIETVLSDYTYFYAPFM